MSTWEIPTEGVNTDGIPAPGVYHVEVASVDTKPTRAGDKMLTLRLKQVSDGRTIVVERLTFGDKARGLSLAKLYALGVERPAEGGVARFEPLELRGKRAAVQIVHQEGTDQDGKPRTEARVAAFNACRPPFSLCGYLSEDEARELGVIGEQAPAPATTNAEAPDSTPF